MEILKFIEQNEMSKRLENSLIIASKKYTYMFELSVIKLMNFRYFGLKQVKELIQIYPCLENEIGFLCYDSIKQYSNK